MLWCRQIPLPSPCPPVSPGTQWARPPLQLLNEMGRPCGSVGSPFFVPFCFVRLSVWLQFPFSFRLLCYTLQAQDSVSVYIVCITMPFSLRESSSQLGLHNNALGLRESSSRLGLHNNALSLPVSPLLDLDPAWLPGLSAFPLIRLASFRSP